MFLGLEGRSFCQADPAITAWVSMAWLQSKKAAVPLKHIFDEENLSESDLKQKKKALNFEFDSLSKEIAKHEKDPALYFKRGIVKVQLDADNSAKDDFDKSYFYGNRTRELYMNLGEVCYRVGFRSNSISYFNAVLKKDSTDGEAYLQRGIAKLYDGRTGFNPAEKRAAESIPDFTKALVYRPEMKEAVILRGLANYYSDKNEAAIRDLLLATEFIPSKPIAFVFLAKIYIETDQKQAACATLRKAETAGIGIDKKLISRSCGKH